MPAEDPGDYEQLKQQFGERLLRLVEERGLTQAELARRIPGKTDAAQINRYTRGKVFPEYRTQLELARALDVSVRELLYGDP